MTTPIEIKVTRVRPIESNNHLKAFVDISINDAITIRNLKVVEGDNGLFVSMPQELSKTNGKWYDSVRCNSKEVREDITDRVLAAYKSEVKE